MGQGRSFWRRYIEKGPPLLFLYLRETPCNFRSWRGTRVARVLFVPVVVDFTWVESSWTHLPPDLGAREKEIVGGKRVQRACAARNRKCTPIRAMTALNLDLHPRFLRPTVNPVSPTFKAPQTLTPPAYLVVSLYTLCCRGSATVLHLSTLFVSLAVTHTLSRPIYICSILNGTGT